MKKLSPIKEWLIYMIFYALVLILVSRIFNDTIYIDNSLFGLWGILSAIIISILNLTIKPILAWITLPITALTLGISYPIINVIILKIADLILGSHFNIKGIFMSFVVAIIISLLNKFIKESIIVPILKGRD